jgi:hypothetical protein
MRRISVGRGAGNKFYEHFNNADTEREEGGAIWSAWLAETAKTMRLIFLLHLARYTGPTEN